MTLFKVMLASFNPWRFKRNSSFLRSLVDPSDSVRTVGRQMFPTANNFNDRNASIK